MPIFKSLDAIPGKFYLFLATIIFAAANATTSKLMQLGAQQAVNGVNPISLCNVLFVGNACALLLLVGLYRQQLRRSLFAQLNYKDWLVMVLVAILSGALAPALIFAALDLTSVNNVILLTRLEPPLALILAVSVLKERVNHWVAAGAAVSFAGVIVTVLLQSPIGPMMAAGGFQIGVGDVAAMVGAIAAAVATTISKASLQRVPLGLFTVFRTALGTIVFFVAAIALYGPEHFEGVGIPLVWQWMLIYGTVIVVGGQLSWFAGLRRGTAAEISLASSIHPLAGIAAAFAILGDVPTFGQWIGGGTIAIGIVLTQVGVARQQRQLDIEKVENLKEADINMGFKGI
ncbi:MAG: DMT family transporter [Cyanobacteria bacterium P01_E01_bin.45]